MSRRFILLGVILGFMGVAIGAFGAHALQSILQANGYVDTFQTGTHYQMYHALALLGAAWIASKAQNRWINAAGWLFFTGVVIFSGSLYILAIANLKIMGAITPIGGVLMLAGWLCFGVAAWNMER